MQIRQIQPEVIILTDSSNQIDMSKVTSRIMVNRSVNSPVGSCQITFEPSLDSRAAFNITTQEIINAWRKYVKKNSVIAIKIDNKQKKYKFLGFIDQIIESDHSENQSVGRNLTINCSMLIPKLLVRDTIVNAPQLMTNETLKSDPKWSKRLDFFTWLKGYEKDSKENVFAATPYKAILWILDNCIATNSEYTFDGKKLNAKAFIDPMKTDYNGVPLLDFMFLLEEKLFAPQLTMFTGTLLEYIYQCLDRDFYEIFFDATTLKYSGSPVNKITIRPKPFSRKMYRFAQEAKIKNNNWLYWEDLPVRKINKSMRLRESISQTDFEVKNFFRTTYENQLIASASSTAGKFGLNYPVMNLKSMEKYGIRELKTSSRMLNIEGQTQQENYNNAIKDEKEALTILEDQAKTIGLFDKLMDKRNRIVEWYGFPNYETGQITLMGGYDEYNPGERLYYEDKIYWDEERDKEFKGVLYYINDVSEQANYSQGKYTVTLGLTRGAPAFEGSDDYVVKWFERHEADFIRIEKLPNTETSTAEIKLEPQKLREIREALPKTMLEIPELKAE